MLSSLPVCRLAAGNPSGEPFLEIVWPLQNPPGTVAPVDQRHSKYTTNFKAAMTSGGRVGVAHTLPMQ